LTKFQYGILQAFKLEFGSLTIYLPHSMLFS